MKDQETRERLVELRARGLSFDKISKELKVSKQTLIDWSRGFLTSQRKGLGRFETKTRLKVDRKK